MKLIAITTPKIIDEDAYIITKLLDIGIDIVHLRKPESNVSECRRLLTALSDKQRERIVIHDYPELFFEFALRGIHINKSVTTLPKGYNGTRSRSCHTLEEVTHFKNDYDYLFLSPIFDSISKAGYRSGFSHKELLKASVDGIIDNRVIALGGVTFDRIAYLKELNFGGAAMLGAVYSIEEVNRLNDISIY